MMKDAQSHGRLLVQVALFVPVAAVEVSSNVLTSRPVNPELVAVSAFSDIPDGGV